MKRKLTGLLAVLLAAALLLPSAALAAEAGADGLFQAVETQPLRAVPGGAAPDSGGEPSGRDLFSGYIAGRFAAAAGAGGAAPASAGDSAGSRLKGTARRLYDLLKEKVTATAREGGSSVYVFDASELGLKTEWTPQELTGAGFSLPESNADLDLLYSKICYKEGFSLGGEELNAVKNALLADCPFDLYWFDKTAGLFSGLSGGYGYRNGFQINLHYTFGFSVAGDYQAPDSTGDAPAVTSDVARVDDAARNAAAIVAKYRDQTDYIKLAAYKAEICDLTDYNYDALNSSTAYGDPWQLIWVFDGDPETKVVCEGYSKAFQFLCDLSVFDDADCYTVSGLMGGGTGGGPDGAPGPHMWNIVRIGGKSYLTDITNSDEGSAGQDGGLFLAGAAVYAASEPAGYTVTLENGQNIYYWYEIDDSMAATWGETLLVLSQESYEPGSSPVEPDPPHDEDTVMETPVWKSDGALSVSISVAGPACLLAAAYDQDWRLTDLFTEVLDTAGHHSRSFTLPAGVKHVKVLAVGAESWSPLCASKEV